MVNEMSDNSLSSEEETKKKEFMVKTIFKVAKDAVDQEISKFFYLSNSETEKHVCRGCKTDLSNSSIHYECAECKFSLCEICEDFFIHDHAFLKHKK